MNVNQVTRLEKYSLQKYLTIVKMTLILQFFSILKNENIKTLT